MAIRDSRDMLQTRMHSLLTHIPRPDNSWGFRSDWLETQVVLIMTIAEEEIPEPNTQLIKLLRFRVRLELTAESSRTLLALLKKKKKEATETSCPRSDQFGTPQGRL